MPGLLIPKVTTNLIYSDPPEDGSKAFTHINTDPLTGKFATNLKRTAYTVEIEDLRGRESEASLDTTGFLFFNAAAKHTAFVNNEDIEKEYYPESVELIKRLTGATRVVIFDHSLLFFSSHEMRFNLCPSHSAAA